MPVHLNPLTGGLSVFPMSQPTGRKRMPVTTRLHAGGLSDGSVNTFGYLARSIGLTSCTYRVKMYITADCSSLRLTYVNGSTEFPNTNAVAYEACVEDSAGNIYRVYFDAATSVSIPAGGFKESDSLGVSFAKGEQIWIRSLVTMAVGEYHCYGVHPRDSGEGRIQNANYVAGGGSGWYIGDGTYPVVAPACVTGEVDANAICIAALGDSHLAIGVKLSTNAAGNGGYLTQVLGAANFGQDYPHIHLSLGGQQAGFGIAAVSFSTNAGSFIRKQFLSGCTSALIALGLNDFRAGCTASALKGYNLAIAKECSNRYGIRKRIVTTITPDSTSSDSFATVAAQTTTFINAARIDYNDWIRAGAPVDPTTLAAVSVGTSGALLMSIGNHPFTSYFELADAVESARNSGKWKATGSTTGRYTADGYHFSIDSGLPAITGAVVLSQLT